MERLTKMDNQGRLLVYLSDDTGLPNIVLKSNPYRNVVLKLLNYEDAGLSPDDICKPQKLEEWNEEYGDCLWWRFPVEEPPYCGSPLDCDFPRDVTHFTRFVIPQKL